MAEVCDGAAGFMHPELMRADHAARGIHGRHVDGDVVAAMQDIVEVVTCSTEGDRRQAASAET